MTDYSSEDFWRGAPADAQAFMPGSYQWIDGWWKKKGDQFYFWPFSLGESGGWAPSYARPFDHPDVVMRPAPPWSGDGLPPVGTDCEAYSVLDEGWYQVKILDHQGSNGAAACRKLNDALFWSAKFRQIKTPAQIAAEEREAAIDELTAGLSNDTLRSWAIRAYDDLGYRKGDDQ